MIRFLRDWVDDRTGLGKVVDAMLLEHIPGGARWRYVWGSALAIVFSIQLITGVLLMTAYSPGDTTAWTSVYFIQYEMDFGWLIRGLHHFGSQTMVVLMALHVLQVVIAGAHLKPREVNWWLGLGLMGVVLGLSLTGYLLPWDQKGYYATKVATGIAGSLPVIGPFIEKTVVGGSQYGNHTLTRFFGLHVAILPGLAILLLIAHIWVFRRHGVTTARNATGSGWFWPDQAFRDMVVGLIIFGIMLGLVLYGWGHKIEPPTDANGAVVERSLYDRIAHAGRDGLGANLDAPADPNVDYPARPEWYFLFLFQLLKYFKGPQALIGTVVIPGAIALILFLMPLLGYGKLRPLGWIFGVLFVLALIGGAIYLTAQAWVEDQAPETFEKEPYKTIKKLVAANRYDEEAGKAHQKHMHEADERARLAIQAAAEGSPPVGGRYLLRNHPQTTGKALFKQQCASCHNYHDPAAAEEKDRWMNSEPTAADLTDWGSKDWILGLLKNTDDPKYFGRSHLKGGEMSKWVADQWRKANTEEKKKALEEDFDAIAEFLATHPRKEPGEDAPEKIRKGASMFGEHCAGCHDFLSPPDQRVEKGPDLTGYGDEQWLREMIMVPQHKYKYGNNNRMPGFRDLTGPATRILEEPFVRAKTEALEAIDDEDEKKAEEKRKAVAAAHQVNHLTDLERELIIRFLLKDNRVIFGGDGISGPPPRK